MYDTIIHILCIFKNIYITSHDTMYSFLFKIGNRNKVFAYTLFIFNIFFGLSS